MTSRLLVLSLLTIAAEASAYQLIEVESGQSYTVRVSLNDLSYIAMDGSLRLSSVWGMEDAVTIERDDELGRALIKPVAKKPFSVIVTDENGDTYSLVAAPANIPSEIIVLKPKRAGKTLAAQPDPDREQPYVTRLKRLFRSVAAAGNSPPAGYQLERIGRQVPLWVEANLDHVARYRGADIQLDQFRLTNVTDDTMRLHEDEFAAAQISGDVAADVAAVAIADHVLAPGQSTEVWIARRGRE